MTMTMTAVITANPVVQKPSRAEVVSQQLREVSRREQAEYISYHHAAGVHKIDGWLIEDLIVGKINHKTGHRVFPDGTVNKAGPNIDHNKGHYYGSIPTVPVHSLYQTGVIWTEV